MDLSMDGIIQSKIKRQEKCIFFPIFKTLNGVWQSLSLSSYIFHESYLSSFWSSTSYSSSSQSMLFSWIYLLSFCINNFFSVNFSSRSLIWAQFSYAICWLLVQCFSSSSFSFFWFFFSFFLLRLFALFVCALQSLTFYLFRSIWSQKKCFFKILFSIAFLI